MNKKEALEKARNGPKIIQNPDGSLDKISCLRWAKYMGFNLPEVFWQQLKEHDEKGVDADNTNNRLDESAEE